MDISVRGEAGFATRVDDIFGGRLLLKLSLLLALSLGTLLFLACQLFLPFLEGLTWAHASTPFLREEHARCGIAGPAPVWSAVLR
jgi:O-antigen/teichoic acid export membrane protein